MFTKVLIPLDRSPVAEQALGQAVAIARASKAEMDLVLVHEPFPFDGIVDAPWNFELWNEGRQYLESMEAEIASGSSVAVTHAMFRGDPADMICRRIEDVHADLVVMTSHGRMDQSRARMGSVADGVLRHSTVPVLMLRPIENNRQRRAAHRLFKHVLVPVDGSALSTAVFAAATSLANCSGARLSLLCIVEPIPQISTDAGIRYMPAVVDEPAMKHVSEQAQKHLEEMARRLRDESGAEIDTHVVVDAHVTQAILDFARTHDVDVIAMSTHGSGISRLLLGSIADKVLWGSPVPLLLYHPLSVQARVHKVETSGEANGPARSHT